MHFGLFTRGVEVVFACTRAEDHHEMMTRSGLGWGIYEAALHGTQSEGQGESVPCWKLASAAFWNHHNHANPNEERIVHPHAQAPPLGNHHRFRALPSVASLSSLTSKREY